MRRVALVLAAGAGTRFGGDKLAAPLHGIPLLHHAIRVARAAPVERVTVVCPPGMAIGDWPGEPPVEALRVASDALSASLRAGIAAAGDADGAYVFLGDMPLVPPAIAGQLAAALGKGFAAAPRHAGRQGHPVLLARRAFEEVARLEGDAGAGRLLKARADVAFVDCPVDTVLLDVDRREDLARIERRDSA